MKPLRTIAVFPTMLTLANLVCGFFAIVVASRVDAPTEEADKVPDASGIVLSEIMRVPKLDPADPTHNVVFASWLIFIAMICDMLDGRVARLTRNTSDFGGHLDTLADVVSFGVAPGFLLVKMCPGFTYEYRQAIWIIAATFAVCAALRLARFAVETTEDEDHLWFHGLPSPAAAAVVAGYALLFYKLRSTMGRDNIDLLVQYGLPLLTVFLSLAMVTRIPYPHIVSHLFRGQRSFAHVVGLVFALVPVLVYSHYVVPVLASCYALLPPAVYFKQRLQDRRASKEPLI